MRELVNKVKKIIKMQLRLDKDENLSEIERKKIEKKISRMKKRFFHVITDEENNMEIFFSSWGKHVVVDYKTNTVLGFKGEIPKSFKTNFFSFLIAYMILIFMFLIAIVLSLFGIISDSLLTVIMMVMNGGAVVLNVWNVIDGRELFKKYKLFIVLFAFIIPWNIVCFVGNIKTLME